MYDTTLPLPSTLAQLSARPTPELFGASSRLPDVIVPIAAQPPRMPLTLVDVVVMRPLAVVANTAIAPGLCVIAPKLTVICGPASTTVTRVAPTSNNVLANVCDLATELLPSSRHRPSRR